MAKGALLIDIRVPRLFVHSHIEGSWSILGPRFGLPLLGGDQIPPGSRLIVVADTPVTGQVASDELRNLGLHVIGIFSGQPGTWVQRGLPVTKGRPVQDHELLAYTHDTPSLEILDVREKTEQELFPFTPATGSVPLSTWPDGLDPFHPDKNFLFVSGRDERSVLAAWYAMKRGFKHVGYLVGGIHRYTHGEELDDKTVARTTARHGAFI